MSIVSSLNETRREPSTSMCLNSVKKLGVTSASGYRSFSLRLNCSERRRNSSSVAGSTLPCARSSAILRVTSRPTCRSKSARVFTPSCRLRSRRSSSAAIDVARASSRCTFARILRRCSRASASTMTAAFSADDTSPALLRADADGEAEGCRCRVAVAVATGSHIPSVALDAANIPSVALVAAIALALGSAVPTAALPPCLLGLATVRVRPGGAIVLRYACSTADGR